MKFLLLFFIFLSCMEGQIVSANFFEKRAEGWHWYEEKPKEEDTKRNKPSLERPNSQTRTLTPTEQIESQKKALRENLHTALIYPTPENIKAYMLLQKQTMDQSQRFSEEWQRVVMMNPELDESLKHPVDQNALHVYYDLKNKNIQDHIKDLSRDYGLFYFFKGECSYCHGFAPIVKNFAKKYGWSVLAISLDGGKLSEFPDAKRDNGVSQKLGIRHVPALVAVHPQTGKTIPLAYGMISEAEIEQRISLMAPAHKEDFKK